MSSPPKILFVVSEDWYFCLHWLRLARSVRDAGFDVAVACNVSCDGERITKEGFELIPLNLHRSSLNIFRDVWTFLNLCRILYRTRPAILHNIAMKPILYGSLAACLVHRPAVVNLFAGLGYLFTSTQLKARLIRPIALLAIRLSLTLTGGKCIVLNDDDRAVLISERLAAPHDIHVVPGNGVDIDHFHPLPEPADPPIRIAVVARMIEDKGIRTAVDAFRLLRERVAGVELLLAGDSDPRNPAGIPEQVLRQWGAEPGITWLGYCADVRRVWASAHIAVLASRREGLPVSLLEAAACGRPVVATAVAGCRDVAVPGLNGILVPVDDAPALANALEYLIRVPRVRHAYGSAGRRIVE
ncbi:MAG: glycosyltransferase family 4 protein, partial [Acetobacteraceae bacterium]|nr:glycosyltransferase family 4 protein [Acetobacteraceae bacterium]